jgi:hypothetical protein
VKPLSVADIVGPTLYEGIRDDFRKRVMAHKQDRRIDVGDRAFLVFEDRITLRFQIEEILRAERITAPEQIASEVELYNQLMPTADSLSATLFLSVPRDLDRRSELDRFIGLDEHVILHVGPHAIRAEFEPGRSTDERISAVQYTRYRLTPEAVRALASAGTAVEIEIDHPAYQHRVRASESMRASLASDVYD